MAIHPRGLAHDCGPRLTPLFQRLLDATGDVLMAEFAAAAEDYFAATPHPDPFFNNLAALALPFPGARLADLRLLDIGLQVTHEWESRTRQRVHKGSGYYFAAMRDIVLGDLDRGFLYMHQALVEDQRSSDSLAPDTPALAFVTMNAAKLDQAFGQEVARYADAVERRLATYRSSGRGSLGFADLRARSLARPGLLEPLFSLVFVVARIIRLEQPTVAFARDNQFARLLFGQIAFDLCLIIDQMLNERFPGSGRFLRLGAEYATAAGLGIGQRDLQDANDRFGKDFPGTLATVLDGTYRGSRGGVADLDADFLVAYGVRNRMAHGTATEAAIEERFEEIEARLFFVVFSILERLFA